MGTAPRSKPWCVFFPHREVSYRGRWQAPSAPFGTFPPTGSVLVQANKIFGGCGRAIFDGGGGVDNAAPFCRRGMESTHGCPLDFRLW